MKEKLIYGSLITVLIIISGFLYMNEKHGDEVEIVTEAALSDEVTDVIIPVATVVVYITGEVINPGVYEAYEGQRLYEMIEMAGGFTEEASESSLNLARKVFDGEQVHVPSLEAVTAAEVKVTQNKININQANVDELMELTGVGEAKAEAIIEYRTNNGPYQRIEDIMNVAGIKEAMFNKIKDEIII